MSNQIHILLVDDEELFVANLMQVLRRRGMKVDGVNSGAAALEAMNNAGPGSYNVVVLDMRMPGMDGLATLGAIRRIDPGIAVIILTGHSDLKQVSKVLKEGVDELLLKPCPVDTLVSAIENAHERGLLARELEQKS